MKVRIEFDNDIKEEEIIIRCRELDYRINKIQSLLNEINNESPIITFFQNDKEYYLSLDEILFFETSSNGVDAHTKDNIYRVKFKLYELEEILGKRFIRISKSAIININTIYSINHSITSSSLIGFFNSYKQVYVSRFYYKDLKHRLDERRNYEN